MNITKSLQRNAPAAEGFKRVTILRTDQIYPWLTRKDMAINAAGFQDHSMNSGILAIEPHERR